MITSGRPRASTPARRRREVPVLLLCVLGVLGLFAGKAYAIDDPLFLWLGKHLLDHPLDFYGFDVNWYGRSMPMHAVTMNPPLTGYFIAAVGALAGFSERVQHLAFLVPAAAVCVGTYRLAEDLCARPLLASLAGLLTPVFLVSSTSVMCDTSLLAFWCWSVVCWRRGLLDRRPGLLVLAAVLASAAALTKYYGLALVPLLAVHGFLVRRRAGPWLLPLLIPLGVALAYELTARSLYGHGLIAGARAYASGLRADDSRELLPTLYSGLVFGGGCAASAVFLGPLLAGRRGILAGLGLLLLGALALPAPHRLLGLDPADLVADPRWLDLEILLMACGGAILVLLALAELRSGRGADGALLCLWVLGTLVFAAFVNWTNNGRSNLPMAPAVGILLARRLELRAPAASALARRALAPALGAAILLAVLVTWGDARWADQSRRAAAELAQLRAGRRPLFFQGHWGFQYYAELNGARCFDPERDVFRQGDLVAVPLDRKLVFRLPPTHVRLEQVHEFPDLLPFHTMAAGSGAGFYASGLAPMPFAVGPGRPERYAVYRVEQGFRFAFE